MKKLITIALALSLVAIACIGCTSSIYGSNSTYRIKVSGTPGLNFSGGYTVTISDGVSLSSTSKSVDGTIPAAYTVKGTMVSVYFQSRNESGDLTVQILKGTEVLGESTTSAAYGMVSVTTTK